MKPLLLVLGIIITLPSSTLIFSIKAVAATKPAVSFGWVPPRMRKVPPSMPLSKKYTSVSRLVPFNLGEYWLSIFISVMEGLWAISSFLCMLRKSMDAITAIMIVTTKTTMFLI